MAKDVTEYLAWSSSMEHDERHLMGVKTLTLLGFLSLTMFAWKKKMWSYIKTRYPLTYPVSNLLATLLSASSFVLISLGLFSQFVFPSL